MNIVYPREYIVPINLINIRNFDFVLPAIDASCFRVKEFDTSDDEVEESDSRNPKTVGEIFQEIDDEYFEN